MNHPNRPQEPSMVPGVPPPPPKINVWRLWLTLLAPSGIMVLVMLALVFGGDSEVFFSLSCAVVCIATAAAWGFFIHTIHERFRGPSLVLLILAYPILQGILIFGIFFVGCLAMFSH